MNKRETYRAASRHAQEQRQRFLDSLSVTKERITPARLTQDVKDGIANKAGGIVTGAVTKVRENPWASGAAAAALIGYLARRPIGSLLHRLYVRARTGQWETDDG